MRVFAASTLALAATAATLTAAAPAHAATTVTYEVWGDAATASSITYFDGDDDLAQTHDTRLPATITVSNDSTYPLYGVTAQTNGKGAIHCRITVDGVVLDEQVARGKYTVVSCNA